MNTLDSMYRFKRVNPNKPDIFKAFELCPYSKLKVVFLGQDPYPQGNMATGLAFGNHKEVSEKDLSPSLKIIKDAVIDLEVPHNITTFDQTLESWAAQGVLLLNTALTVESEKPGSHAMLWRKFISHILKSLSFHETAIIYVLLGVEAQTFEPYIDKQYNYIIKHPHPASNARNNTKMDPNLFKDINKIISRVYNQKIKFYDEEITTV